LIVAKAKLEYKAKRILIMHSEA